MTTDHMKQSLAWMNEQDDAQVLALMAPVMDHLSTADLQRMIGLALAHDLPMTALHLVERLEGSERAPSHLRQQMQSAMVSACGQQSVEVVERWLRAAPSSNTSAHLLSGLCAAIERGNIEVVTHLYEKMNTMTHVQYVCGPSYLRHTTRDPFATFQMFVFDKALTTINEPLIWAVVTMIDRPDQDMLYLEKMARHRALMLTPSFAENIVRRFGSDLLDSTEQFLRNSPQSLFVYHASFWQQVRAAQEKLTLLDAVDNTSHPLRAPKI